MAAYDTVVAVYLNSGLNQPGSGFLGVMEIDQVSLEDDQYLGSGRGTFQSRSAWESGLTGNIVAPNRVDCYLRNDDTAATVSSGQKNVDVLNQTRFSVGQTICLYDGVHFNINTIDNIIGGQLQCHKNFANNFGAGIMIGVLRYRGMISQRTLNADLNSVTQFQTVGYGSLLGQAVLDSVNIVDKEAGFCAYSILKSYEAQLNIVVNSTNFVMTSDGSLPGGTGIAYNASSNQVTVDSSIQDIIKTANGNDNGITYTLYLDSNNIVYFQPILSALTSTPTCSASLILPYPSLTTDGIYNVVGAHQTTDQDLSQISNVIKVVGGKDPTTGNNVACIVEDQESIAQYGQREQALSNSYLTTTAAASAWGLSQLAVMAFPRSQSQTTFTTTGSFVTCRDLVEIFGFNDGTNQILNPQSVTTTWEPGQGAFTQVIKSQELYPNIALIMQQISREHFIANNGQLDKGTRLDDRYVLDGLDASFSGNVFSMDAGDVCCITTDNGLVTFSVPSLSYTPPGNGTWSVSWLYRNADGSEITSPTGLDPVRWTSG